MSQHARLGALESQGLVHPRADSVTAALFVGGDPFFLAADKLQVKYEMLRAHVVDGESVSAVAAAHGYSRASFYAVSAAFEEAGMIGLIDGRPGRQGPLKLTAQIDTFIAAASPALSGAEIARQVESRFGVSLHRRTVERARRR
jgi:transposase